MFYCTIYATYPNGRKDHYYIVFSLKYSTEQEADNFRTWFSDLATKYGLEVKTEGEDITCTGKFTWWYHKFIPGKTVIKYTLSMETEDTLHSKYDFSKGYSPLHDPVKDGPSFENKIQQVAAKEEAENKANQEKLLAPVNRFIEETSNTSDLKVILTSLLKYSRQKCDREALLDAAVKKIQSGSKQIEKTSDWYDELSDINS